jgi:hypothetical protein
VSSLSTWSLIAWWRVPLVYTAEGWIPPWREGLPQIVCANPEHLEPDGKRYRIVAITATRGYCRRCTVKLGVAPEDPPPEQQLELEIPLF